MDGFRGDRSSAFRYCIVSLAVTFLVVVRSTLLMQREVRSDIVQV